MSEAISPKKDLYDQEAISKLKEIALAAKDCMFTTSIQEPLPDSRPMVLQDVDDSGNLYFISSTTSKKNEDILKNNKVQLYFINSSKCEFLYILGIAEIITDKTIIEKYWTNFANAWFDGKDDPTVSIIKVNPYDCYYYETKDGKLIAIAKMLLVAATGIKLEDGGVEGNLDI